ncbi:WD40 repeat domain-containing protein [Aggregatilinea lenta]|uniref:WD40 repeat domain-containing protein n=1 Tax=Aggregatilinea lenta TaxID=913108 RepID=UPI0013C32A0B|nr:WD40 repeat domain-containing protein [Aggregatilinea lenta]
MKMLYRVCILSLILGLSVPSFNVAAQSDARITVAVTWSPDGETLAIGGSTASGQGAIWLYGDLGTAIDTIDLPDSVFSVSWSHDGEQLAARYDTEGGTRLAIWDWRTLDPDRPSVTTEDLFGVSDSYRIVWSPTDRYIAANGSSWVYIIDTATGSQVAQLYDEERTGTVGVVDVEWAADEQSIYVLYGGRDANQLLQWDINNAQVIRTVLSGASYSFPIAMQQSPDAQWLAVSVTLGSVFLLSGPDFKVERELYVQQGESEVPYVAYLFWLENSVGLLGLAYDGTSYLWDVDTSDLLTRDTLISDEAIFISDAATSPYGGRLAVATRWRPTALSSTPSYESYITYQSWLDGMLRVTVPAPSFDRLNAIAQSCALNAITPNASLATLTAVPVNESTVAGFVASVNALPDDAMSSACRSDILAIAETLQSHD